MKSEVEIRERLEYIESQLENSSGHDLSYLIGQRNALEWVLDVDSVGGSSSDHWSGSSGGRF